MPPLRRRVSLAVGLLALAAFAMGATELVAQLLPDAESGVLRFGIACVLLFLVVLIVRYVMLLWLGYLHHVEGRERVDDFAV